MTTIVVQPGATEATYQISVTINQTTYEVGATFGQGPRGPAGLVMRGTWDSATAYVADDAVYYLGSSYWAMTASTDVQPDTDDGTHWALLAEKGQPGDVTGPASSTAGHLAVWSGTSGAVLADGGAPLQLGTTASTALAGDTTAADIGALPDTTSIPSTASDVGAVANASGQTLTLWTGTAAQYAAIVTKDASTVYVVTA